MTTDIDAFKKRLAEVYNRATGANFEFENATDESIATFIKWTNINIASNGNFPSCKTKSVLVPDISLTLSDKTNMFSQYHCPVCTSSDASGGCICNIRIKPLTKWSSKSKQKSEKIRAYERAIAHHFTGKEILFKNSNLCVSVLFVLSTNENDKDLDNLAKALLDSLSNILFNDDGQIDHLNMFKIKWDGDEEWISISIKETNINKHDDVIFKNMAHGWAGQVQLNLEDFMDDKISPKPASPLPAHGPIGAAHQAGTPPDKPRP